MGGVVDGWMGGSGIVVTANTCVCDRIFSDSYVEDYKLACLARDIVCLNM